MRSFLASDSGIKDTLAILVLTKSAAFLPGLSHSSSIFIPLRNRGVLASAGERLTDATNECF